MVSVGVAEIAVSVTNADAAKEAVSAFRHFYPDAEITLAGVTVRLSSSKMTGCQLRTAWLCQLLEAETREETMRTRKALLGELFN